jgi:hypothetical protein
LLQLLGKIDSRAKFLLYSEPALGNKDGGVHLITKRDRLVGRRNWQYGERVEMVQYVGGEDVFQQNTKAY